MSMPCLDPSSWVVIPPRPGTHTLFVSARVCFTVRVVAQDSGRGQQIPISALTRPSTPRLAPHCVSARSVFTSSHDRHRQARQAGRQGPVPTDLLWDGPPKAQARCCPNEQRPRDAGRNPSPMIAVPCDRHDTPAMVGVLLQLAGSTGTMGWPSRQARRGAARCGTYCSTDRGLTHRPIAPISSPESEPSQVQWCGSPTTKSAWLEAPPRRPSIFGLAASTNLPTSTIPTLCTLGRPRPTWFACRQCWGPLCMEQHSSAMSDVVPGKQSAVPTSADCMIAWHRQQGGVIHNDVIMQHIANRQSERASFFAPAPRRRVSANSRETTYRIT